MSNRPTDPRIDPFAAEKQEVSRTTTVPLGEQECQVKDFPNHVRFCTEAAKDGRAVSASPATPNVHKPLTEYSTAELEALV